MQVELKAPTWATHFLSDLTDWRRGPIPVGEMRPFTLPDDAYFEYAYQDAQGERHPDPENTNARLNPWWNYACHLVGPQYRPHPLASLPDRRPQGRVLRLEMASRILNESRRLIIYSPAGMANAELPLVLFQDGKAYYGWGKACQVLDELVSMGQVAPAHLVFLPPRKRTPEYAFNPVFQRFVVEELLQETEGRVSCNGQRVAWGASLGGLFSAQLAWDHPHLFQKVVTQSGAFLFSQDMDLSNPFAGNESFLQQVQSQEIPAVQWHLQCGTLEWLEMSNRNLAQALAEKGAPVELRLHSAGHNWVNWRNGMAAGFQSCLGIAQS